MTWEEIKENMAASLIFNEYLKNKFQDETLTDIDRLNEYQNWLTEQIGYAQEGLEKQRVLRAFLIGCMAKNLVFLSNLKAKDEEARRKIPDYHHGKGIYNMDAEESTNLIKGFYLPWLMDEMDGVLEVMTTVKVEDMLQARDCRVLTEGFKDMVSKGEIGQAKRSGIGLQHAKMDKIKVKEDVKNLLGIKSFGVLSKMRGTVTEDAIKLLEEDIGKCLSRIYQTNMTIARYVMAREKINEEVAQIEKNIRKVEEEDWIDVGSQLDEENLTRKKRRVENINKKIEVLEEKKNKLDKRITDAQEYIKLLRQMQLQKKEAEVDYNEKRELAETAFKEKDLTFQKEHLQFLKGTRSLTIDKSEIETLIRQKKTELQKLVSNIEETHKKMWEIKGQIESLAEMSLDTTEAVTEYERLENELESYKKEIAPLSTELAFLDAKYRILWEQAKHAFNEQEELIKQRDEAKEELEWLMKLGKIDKALNIYCSTTNASFGLFLNIGKLVSGEECGPLGATGLLLLTTGATISKGLSSGDTVSQILKGETPGLVTQVLTGGVLSQIHAYDTGTFGLNLMIGLSWGIDFHNIGAKCKAGLALVYDAGINVQDDRRFRTVSTLTVKIIGELEVPKLLQAEIEVEVYKDSTGMTFKDVYHWAAWLAQKWANLRAKIQAVSVYDGEDKFSQPTQKQRERMRELAEITMATDPNLRKILDNILNYMSEPIVRMESKELFGGIGANVEAVETFGVGIELTKTAEPKFFKRQNVGGRVEEEYCKEGKQKTETLSLKAGIKVDIAYQNIEKHANIDNEGRYLNFNISLETLKEKAGFKSESEEEKAEGPIADWIKEHLEGAANKIDFLSQNILGTIKGTLQGSNLSEICANLSFSNFEIVLWRSVLKSGKGKWCFLYFRPIFHADASFKTSISLDAAVPGLKFDVGAGVKLERTYRERIGTGTIGYIQTIFNGLMNITDYQKPKEKEPRPKEAWGTTLWERWVDDHKKRIWDMLKNIATNGKWIQSEALDLGPGEALVSDLRDFRLDKNPGFDETLFKKAYKSFFTFLDASRTSQEYKSKCAAGWEKVEIEEGRFSLMPLLLGSEISKIPPTFTFELATKEFGKRKDLKEQFEIDRRLAEMPQSKQKNEIYWVPDKDASSCQNPNCKVKFTFTTRRHHCRNCGGVFCDKCTSHSIPLPDLGYKSAVRVCDICYDIIKNPKHQRISVKHEKLNKGVISQESLRTKKENIFFSPKKELPKKENVFFSPKKKPISEPSNPFLSKKKQQVGSVLPQLQGQGVQDIQVTACSVSQFQLENGETACNGIATYTALKFLQRGATGLPDSEVLEEYMMNGIQYWLEWHGQTQGAFASTNDMIARVSYFNEAIEICVGRTYLGRFSGIKENVVAENNIALSDALSYAGNPSKASVLTTNGYSLFIGKVAENHWVIFDSHSRDSNTGLIKPREDGGVAVAIRCGSLAILVNQLKQMYGNTPEYNLDFLRLI